MSFAAPLFLLTLFPWAALSLWLLWGRRRRVRVPFVALWKIPQRLERPPRALEWPPAYVVLILGAVLLAILAAARPSLGRRAEKGEVTVVVDRSPMLSAARYEALVDLAAGAIAEAHPAAAVRLVLVPGDTVRAGVNEWAATAKRHPPAADGVHELHATLATTPGRLILVSDRAIVAEGRIVQITSSTPPANVGITHVAARQTPTPAMMVTLRNDSPRTRAAVRVDGSVHELPLPPAGASRDYFLPLPAAKQVRISLAEGDDVPADDVATLARRPIHPRPEARSVLPAAVQRVIDDYRRLRPGDDSSAAVAVVTSIEALPVNEPAVALLRGTKDVDPRAFVVAEHAVTRGVTAWPRATAVVSAPEAAPVVRSPEGAVVAVWRGRQAMQLLVGLDVEAWAQTPDFVVFMANAFEAVAPPGGEAFAAEVAKLPERAAPTEWRPRLGQVVARPAARPTPLARLLLLAAVAATLSSLLTWRTSDRTD